MAKESVFCPQNEPLVLSHVDVLIELRASGFVAYSIRHFPLLKGIQKKVAKKQENNSRWH